MAVWINWTTPNKELHRVPWLSALQYLNNTSSDAQEQLRRHLNSGRLNGIEDIGSLPIMMPPFRPNKGRFIDGVWHCNCDPRLPASHFQVKKESANKGRWFYCCTKPKEEQCGFFLWDEDAKFREEGTLLSNTRTEQDVMPPPETPKKQKWSSGAGNDPMTPVSMQKTTPRRTPGHTKGQREASPLSEIPYYYGFGGLDEYAGDGMNPPYETPSEASPTRKRKRDSVSDNDSTSAAKRLSPPASHQKPARNGAVKTEAIDGFPTTPSTIRRLDFGLPSTNHEQRTPGPVLAPPSRTPGSILQTPTSAAAHTPGGGNYDITSTILSVLENSHVSLFTRQTVQQILNQHALRVSGIEKGRDISRSVLKKKDEKIAELELRIQQLEQERELDRTVIRHFKRDMAESVAKRGRGRGKG